MLGGSPADAQSLQAWMDFLNGYANGEWLSDTMSRSPPPIPVHLENDGPDEDGVVDEDEGEEGQDETSNYPSEEEQVKRARARRPSRRSLSNEELIYDFDNPVYSSVEITPTVAARVRAFYARYRFLPPPRAPLEFLREQCIQEYDLHSEIQTQNVQAAMDLVFALLGGVVNFSLFKHSQQELIAMAGKPEVIASTGLEIGQRLLPETSMCGHTLLAKKTVYVPDLALDWRHQGNPYSGGLKSYIGSVVSLSADPASATEDRVIAVGVINLMFMEDYQPPLRADQQKVLDHITRMLETQLRATWEGHKRTREARARRAISDYIETTLVQPVGAGFDQSAFPESSSVSSPSDVPSSSQGRTDSDEERNADSLAMHASFALKKLRAVLNEVDTAAVVDVRSLQPISMSGEADHAPIDDAVYPFSLLAWDSSVNKTRRPSFARESTTAISNFLRLYRLRRNVIYDSNTTGPSGFEPYLPASATTHLCIPFFSGSQPLFVIIAATSRPFYSFRASEINFVRSMGVVLRARLLQARVLEADAAKTAFLSSISHELRTPMHGVLSGLQLMRDAVQGGDMVEMEKLLSMTESSGQALESILNDVLDFGSWQQGGKVGVKKSERDLGNIILAAAGMCLPRMVAGGENEQVEMVVELEDRDWRAIIDEVGFQRILLNGLTNAIKFTKAGRITLKLRSTPDNARVVLQVRDTGPGIDPAFSAKVFEPFTKANNFAPGAGLGLHITRALADRMGGSVSLTSLPKRGALFEVELPVEMLGSCPKDTHVVRHIIGRTPLPTSADVNDVSQTIEQMSIKPDPAATDVPLRVLVADDNEIGRKILVTVLQRIGKTEPIAIIQASDGLEALEKFQVVKPHLVLTDVSMPRMDGVTAASEMRRVEKEWSLPKAKIYAITGLGSSDPRLKTESLRGAAALDGWLIKGQDKLVKVKAIVAEVRETVAASAMSPVVGETNGTSTAVGLDEMDLID